MNLQAAHSAIVGNQTYGRTSNDLAYSTSRQLYEFCICSRRWHFFLQLTKSKDAYSSHIPYSPKHDAFRCNILEQSAPSYGVPPAIRYIYEGCNTGTRVDSIQQATVGVCGEALAGIQAPSSGSTAIAAQTPHGSSLSSAPSSGSSIAPSACPTHH